MELKELIRSLLFPKKCPSCHALLDKEERVCPSCLEKFEREKSLPCRNCYKPARDCDCRIRFDRFLDAHFFAAPYDKNGNGVARNLVLSAKNRRTKELVSFMTDEMLRSDGFGDYVKLMKDSGREPIVTFVPRDPDKIVKTGFDQSEELAKGLGQMLGLPCLPLLERKRKAKSQKSLDKTERLENARNSIKAGRGCDGVNGADIILVDDVLTTGASVSASAEKLKKAGAGSVAVVTFAKAMPLGGMEEK